MNPAHPSTVGNLKCFKFFTVNNNSAINMKVKVAQSCPTLCDPMDYTVHGILQARILEWVAFLFSRGSSQPRDRTQVSCIAGRSFTNWAMREVLWRNICSHFNYFLRIDFQKWNYRSKAVILYTHRHIYIKSKLLGPPIIMGCNLSGFSVQGILQAKILEWVAMPSFRGSSWPRDQTCIFYVSCISR